MATQIHSSQAAGTPSPRYTEPADDPFSSVHRLSSSSSSAGIDTDGHSIMTAPPPYDATATPFLPTLQLQIETPGKPLLSLPLPPRPDPIPIFTIPTTDSLTPSYLSLRPTRSSGSSFLISPSASDPSSDEHSPLSTTTYRFGPGRPPTIRLFLPGTTPATSNPFLPDPDHSSSPEDVDLSTWDTFPMTSPSLLSRTTAFRTRLGTFQWRYASRSERKLLTPVPSSLLILDRIVKIAVAQSPGSRSSKRSDEIRTPIAQLVRSDEYRTEGSSCRSAGNGGRLLVDLRVWEEEGEKTEREMAVVMAVTTGLVMLKKEVDRRRAQQIMVMAGAAGGGS